MSVGLVLFGSPKQERIVNSISEKAGDGAFLAAGLRITGEEGGGRRLHPYAKRSLPPAQGAVAMSFSGTALQVGTAALHDSLE